MSSKLLYFLAANESSCRGVAIFKKILAFARVFRRLRCQDGSEVFSLPPVLETCLTIALLWPARLWLGTCCTLDLPAAPGIAKRRTAQSVQLAQANGAVCIAALATLQGLRVS